MTKERRQTIWVNRPDGSIKILLSSEASAIIERQRQLFVEKFGRDPGPNDPVFFDPDAETPTKVSMRQFIDNLRDIARKAGVDPDAATEHFVGREALDEYNRQH